MDATRLKIAIENAFEAEPQLNELYVNADGSCFEKKDDALVHAGLIDDNTVILVGKDDKGQPMLIEKVYPLEENAPKAPAVETPGTYAPEVKETPEVPVVETPGTDAPEVKETPEVPAVESPGTDAPEVKETPEVPVVETPGTDAPEVKASKKNAKK